jgi:DNA-binding beta-propeller fold protein YncE
MKPKAAWIVLIVVGLGATGVLLGTRAKGRTVLHNGWALTPAGQAIELPGDMPGNIVLADGGKYALVNTCGFHDHSLSVVDTRTAKLVQKYDLGKAWIGLALNPRTGTVYVSGARPGSFRPTGDQAVAGAQRLTDAQYGQILRFHFSNGRLEAESPLTITGLEPTQAFVSSLLVLPDGSLLAANIQNDTVYRLGRNGESLQTVKTGYRPYGLAISPNRRNLAVSNWGGKSVSVVSLPAFRVVATVPVGAHPNALAYSKDGRLFVCNAGSNTVSVIKGDHVVEEIRTSLKPGDKIGSTPIALALDERNKQLYVANADNNTVAVADISHDGSARVLGFVPTGRYPSALSLSGDGGVLMVATAKGMRPFSNVTEAQASTKGQGNDQSPVPYTYNPFLLQGHLSFVKAPSARELARYTSESQSNRPVHRLSAQDQRLLATLRKNIRHVLYVIKENRTYDQVLGDIKAGNGDPRLVMYGEDVTPNQHRLARDFLLLDNLYCDGETSQVGHQWSDGAYANDYTEKQWIMNYSGRGEVESDARMFTSPAGYIWQHARRHGKTARIYGEYIQWQEDHGSAHGDVKANPEKYGCSAAFEEVFARGGRDTEKVDVFLNELREYERKNQFPNFMIMALPEDHTRGLNPGSYTPKACVGSNDLAVGRLIEGLSRSKFWKNTAVFVIQDDAQSGPDHVDCHRTLGGVFSPYVKRGYHDSSRYTTSSMIRTMGLLLGLPPLTQYDEAAMPMLGCFTSKPNLTPWKSLPARIDLNQKNPDRGALVERSLALDMSDIDRADEQEFNKILWADAHPGVPMPPPVRGL